MTPDNPTEVCAWVDDGSAESWHSSCGQDFMFNDGGPKQNGFKFCYSCGKPLEEIPARFDEWGDPIQEDEEDEDE